MEDQNGVCCEPLAYTLVLQVVGLEKFYKVLSPHICWVVFVVLALLVTPLLDEWPGLARTQNYHMVDTR